MDEDKKQQPPNDDYHAEQELKRQGEGHLDETPGMEKLENEEATSPNRLANTLTGKKAAKSHPETPKD